MTAKQDRVARLVQDRIGAGSYADGEPVVLTEVAMACGVHRDVVGLAMRDLEDQGLVSQVRLSGQKYPCYVANATHVSQQLQRVLALAGRLDIVAKQVNTAAWYLGLSRYGAPSLPAHWSD